MNWEVVALRINTNDRRKLTGDPFTKQKPPGARHRTALFTSAGLLTGAEAAVLIGGRVKGSVKPTSDIRWRDMAGCYSAPNSSTRPWRYPQGATGALTSRKRR